MICPQCLRPIHYTALVSGPDEEGLFMGFTPIIESEPSGVVYRAYNGRMVESQNTKMTGWQKGKRYMHKDCPQWTENGVSWLHFYTVDASGNVSERIAKWRAK